LIKRARMKSKEKGEALLVQRVKSKLGEAFANVGVKTHVS
jgi:hypothetical protein